MIQTKESQRPAWQYFINVLLEMHERDISDFAIDEEVWRQAFNSAIEEYRIDHLTFGVSPGPDADTHMALHYLDQAESESAFIEQTREDKYQVVNVQKLYRHVHNQSIEDQVHYKEVAEYICDRIL